MESKESAAHDPLMFFFPEFLHVEIVTSDTCTSDMDFGSFPNIFRQLEERKKLLYFDIVAPKD